MPSSAANIVAAMESNTVDTTCVAIIPSWPNDDAMGQKLCSIHTMAAGTEPKAYPKLKSLTSDAPSATKTMATSAMSVRSRRFLNQPKSGTFPEPTSL